jgi:hypothetical protein
MNSIIYIYIYVVSILHVSVVNMGPAQDPYATRQSGSVWPGYNILAVS